MAIIVDVVGIYYLPIGAKWLEIKALLPGRDNIMLYITYMYILCGQRSR